MLRIRCRKIFVMLILLTVCSPAFAFFGMGIWKFKDQIENCDKSVIPLIEEDLKNFHTDDDDWEGWIGRSMQRYMPDEYIYFEVPEDGDGYTILEYYLNKQNVPVIDFLINNFEHYEDMIGFIDDAINTKNPQIIDLAMEYHKKQNNFSIHEGESLCKKYESSDDPVILEGLAKYCNAFLERREEEYLFVEFIDTHRKVIEFASEHKLLNGNMKCTDVPAISMFLSNWHFKADEIEKRIELVKIFLDSGADINAVNDANETALFYAIDKPEAVKFLLNQGADKQIKNKYGQTAYDLAVKRYNKTKNNNYEETINLLSCMRL